MCLDNDDNTFAITSGCVYITINTFAIIFGCLDNDNNFCNYIWMLDNDDNTFAIIFGCA